MPQAANLTCPNNKPVKGSKYAKDRWPSYNQKFNRHQRSQQKSYLAYDYCKLRYKNQIEKQKTIR